MGGEQSTSQKHGVFSFGSGLQGELANGKTVEDQIFPELCCQGIKLEDICSIASGPGCFSLVLTSGEVLLWGSNAYCRLGHSDDSKSFIENPHNFSLENKKVVKVCHTFSHSLFLDEDGCVWGCGRNKENFIFCGEMGGIYSTPVLITSPEREYPKMKDIVAGVNHFGCISEKEGELYTWGGGTQGKLGHSDTMDRKTPKLVSYFVEQKKKVKQVAMGGEHTLVLSEDGKVYSFGHDYHGSLGRKVGEYYPKSTPCLCTYLPCCSYNEEESKNSEVVEIDCSGDTCGCIDIQGRCFIWGDGPLGDGKEENFGEEEGMVFQLNKIINGIQKTVFKLEEQQHRFIHISMGSKFFCILEDTKEKKFHVVTWGKDNCNLVGVRWYKKDFLEPTIIPFFEDRKVEVISRGYGGPSVFICGKM